jgi:putative tryptophan/tyrosine transport system substrate-binding protein
VPALVDELLALGPDVLTGIEQVAKVMASKTSTVPIVMVSASDPVAAGLVKSLSHPGGNVTGVSQQAGELGPKRIELVREVFPGLARVGQLHDINVPASKAAEAEARQAAEKFGMTYVPYYVGNRSDLERAFAEMEKTSPDALIAGAGSGLLYGLRQAIVDNTLRLRIPSCWAVSVHAKLGALMSYGPDLPEGNRLAATYVDRILKGAKPSELPIEQPTKFELVINLKTAKALGLTVPPTLLARADEVIE